MTVLASSFSGRRLQRSLRRHPVGALDLEYRTPCPLPHAADAETAERFQCASIALPCGSRTPDFNVTVTRASCQVEK